MKYNQRDDRQKLANSLLYAVLTFIYLYNTNFVTFLFPHTYGSICDLRFGGRIFTF